MDRMRHFISNFGQEYWFDEGEKLHRIDGPAYIESNGDEVWMKNDSIHRENNPAVIDVNGYDDLSRKFKLFQ